MAATIKYRSESIRLKVTLTVGGVAVDLDDYSGIVVVLYYDKNQVLASYSRDAVEGYNNDDFIVINAASGRFDILVQPSLTIPSNVDEIKMEVQVQKTDADWEDDTWRKIVSDISVLSLKDSRTKTLPTA